MFFVGESGEMKNYNSFFKNFFLIQKLKTNVMKYKKGYY